MIHKVFIGIGSNLGDRLGNCEKAILLISKIPGTQTVAQSKWYNTKALTKVPSETQPDYINGIVKIETCLEPHNLLNKLKTIEAQLGRNTSAAKWSPRKIDLDILFYDQIVLDAPNLMIPHPELCKRIFVLKPLCDIEPTLLHPVLNVSVKELYDSISNTHDNRHCDLFPLEMDDAAVRKS